MARTYQYVCLLLFAAAFGAACSYPAVAQDVSVRKLWYGQYAVGESKQIEDRNSPTGTRYENTDVTPPASNASDIELRKEIYFGFGYIVTGNGEIEEYFFLPNAVTGAAANPNAAPQFRQYRRVRSGEDHFIGWYTGGQLKGTPPGEWVFQIRLRGRVLVEHNFFVRSVTGSGR